jgi:hypothetical protein
VNDDDDLARGQRGRRKKKWTNSQQKRLFTVGGQECGDEDFICV